MSFSSSENTKKQVLVFAILVAAMFSVAISSAHAGGGGMEFETVWDTVKDWTQGTLGRVIAGSMVLVGIIGGIARQSLMSFALGIGGGIGLYNAPDVIESIVGATLEHATLIESTVRFGNGLM